MIVASVVLPSPGGPYKRTWSSASPRDLAASTATERFSFTFFCPMHSRRERGRSLSSYDASSSACTAETRRSLSLSSGLGSEADTIGDGKANWKKKPEADER